ncbi:carboxylate--amine ligase [Helcobacillus sp. ACRRO]|uniref:carboxylate--amine ligase n=1 Tax=Helcobacillus sp. ACRRO TaxID=2918202 RepID=UPI001EF71418|nr:carboxylate--amine ligase [Helcobacillus sp. ACRRO]MCG7426357.1 carboxylate--amine ligase [Helcobacillus sp. ACRRO]
MRSHTPAEPRDDFDVVILGAGLNSLNLAIAFHAQYGMRSTFVMRSSVAMNEKTVTADAVALPLGTSDEEFAEALVELARRRPAGRPALLLTNDDTLIAFIDRFRDQLEPHYLLTQIPRSLLDQLADKAEFAEICAGLDIPTPPTVTVDFSRAGQEGWNGHEELPWQFPVVAKPARTSDYAHVDFPGKRKVFMLESEQERRDLVESLTNAGFRGRFLFQELIEGDDTTLRSITAYRSTRGRVTLLCAAQVLLGEHTPEALGRPAAMITGSFPELTAQAERFLDHVDYVGFANFDLKVDPRTGEAYFLEINPRIGRNNYYVTGAGEPVSRHIVADRIDGVDLDQVVVDREVLYSIVPRLWVRRYIRDRHLRRRFDRIARRALRNPFRYGPERLWIKAYSVVSGANFVRKYLRVYPRPTDSGF